MQYWADALADEGIVEISYSKPCQLIVVLVLLINDANWDLCFTSEIKKRKTNKKKTPQKTTWKHPLESTSFVHFYITEMKTGRLKKSNGERETKHET